MKKINGHDVADYDGFAFDGCHKIYLFKGMRQRKWLEKYGYDVYALNYGIIQAYIDSCSLRFIQTCGMDECGGYQDIVPQFADEVVFEGFNELDKLDLNGIGQTVTVGKGSVTVKAEPVTVLTKE